LKRIGFIITICLLYNPSIAQLLRSYGVKVGIVTARQHWAYSNPADVPFDTKTRLGIDVGGYVEWFEIPFISVLTECHYVQKGLKDVVAVTNENGIAIGMKEIIPQIDYLSLPLLVKLRIDLPQVTPYILAGWRYDVLLSTKAEGDEIVLNKLKKWDSGFTVGIGVESNIVSRIKIGLECRYSPSTSYAIDDIVYIFGPVHLNVKNESVEFLCFIGF
jgi:hypothetical protein